MNIDQLTQHMDSTLWVGDLRAKSKDEVLQKLTEALVASGKVKDQAVILEMLRNREALGSTAVGNGIAFPHGRSLAVSRMVPLGCPVAGFISIIPPDGHGVSLVMPAISSAFEFTQME